MDDLSLERIKSYLQRNLSRDRFFHSLEVVKTAEKLARIHKGINLEKVRLAGLVHDMARDLSPEKLIKLACKFRINIDSFTKNHPILLHAPVGASLSRKKFGIHDKEVLQAIERHCVPKPCMSFLDKIIYLSDIIAPTPKIWAGSKITLKIASKSLDQALLYAFNENIRQIIKKEKGLHPDLVRARNKLLANFQKKVLVLGARGMLGSGLKKEFQNYKLTAWDRKELDITNKKKLQQKILELKPEIIINAAAYTNVERAESNQEMVLRTNGKAVGHLAQIAKKINAILVHYSTDYVFDGKNRKGYKETAQPNPINVYGKSKFLGEALLRRNTDQYYLIRSSWMFGKRGKNFVKKMLQLSKSNARLKVVNDQWGKPTFARDLAYKTKELIEQDKPFGIYHITNEGKTNWYQFARKIFALKNIPVKVKPVSNREYKTKAKRPLCSVLINTKLPKLRRWEEALEEYLR